MIKKSPSATERLQVSEEFCVTIGMNKKVTKVKSTTQMLIKI